jgi:hypothetical protein
MFKGGMCFGAQLDMWTNTDLHICYAAINISHVDEPSGSGAGMKDPQLLLVDELLSFGIFPFSQHTGENIRVWFVKELDEAGIPHPTLSGVPPDGASDGQAGMNQIETIREKVDTCNEHQLQRTVLFSLGVAGATSKNPEAKGLLRKHARVAQLSVQSRAVGDGIREKQVEAGVPAHKILSTHKKGATRWGGHKLMVTRNIVLRPAIDPTIDKFKRENRGKADAIVESNEAESGSKGGVRGRGLGDGPLPLLPLGLGFFARARELPRVPLHHQGYQIEHGKSIIHGGQALMLMCTTSRPSTRRART